MQEFILEGFGVRPRNVLLQVLVACIYNVAKEHALFTTDDVFAQVRKSNGADYTTALRRATGKSKLIAVALRKAVERGMCQPTRRDSVKVGDALCHGRRKTLWASKIAQPRFAGE